MSSQSVRPPGPVSPLAYNARRGELKVTTTGIIMWTGTDWTRAIIPLYVVSPLGLVYQLTVSDAGVLGTVLTS